MKDISKFKKFLEWFFEEEKGEASAKDKEEEYVELNLQQLVGIAIITVIFAGWIFYGHIAGYFSKKSDLVDKKIEVNYFEKNKALRNGDFSNGLAHWSTSDGGEIFPGSKSKIFLEAGGFYSPPYSLRIESVSPANRYYYTKNADAVVLDNPYESNNYNTWLGILPNSKVKVSLWCKGDVATLYLQCLNKDGSWKNIGTNSSRRTNEWEKIEVESIVPCDGRAIMIEITLNQASGMPLPVAWIDDVNVEVR